PEYQYGDELEISGKLKTPIVFEDFNYKEFLDKDDIYSVCYKPEIRLVSSDNGNFIYRNLFNFKNKLKKIIARILPEPESSFLSALLLGIKGSIPKDILDNFSKTGISHIIAISGLHITILLGVISCLLSSVSRKNSF
ncbi:DNA internalization-related competence protein ComEC/Rec2, partial [bacterium (Candidatus Howlettbacteria) CG_4_10_14_3_um_filter_37_10]